jgi:hypothetical protein
MRWILYFLGAASSLQGTGAAAGTSFLLRGNHRLEPQKPQDSQIPELQFQVYDIDALLFSARSKWAVTCILYGES